MANIATCPQCAKQLGLPDAISLDGQMECPECGAIFSLGETVQITLPVARVLANTEPLPVEAPTESVVADPQLTLENDAAPQQKSWEERLKNALALGESATEEIETPETSVAEQIDEEFPTVEPSANASPSFDFQLDAPEEPADPVAETVEAVPRKPFKLELPSLGSSAQQPTDPDPEVESATSTPKTLADFAAAMTAHPLADDETQIEESLASAETLADDERLAAEVENLLSQKPATSFDEKNASETFEPGQEVAQASTVEQDEPSLAEGFRPRKDRRSPLLTALAVGPALGGVLGLYGLLWLQGERADYVGLAKVLPMAMLPPDMREPLPKPMAESMLAKSESEEAPSEIKQPEQESSTSLAASDSIKHDNEVQPAAASMPMPMPKAQTPRASISASMFQELVMTADMALTNFLMGDLSDTATVRSKGQAYISLCRLAEHYDFTQQLGLAPSARLYADRAEQLFQKAVSNMQSREDLAHIAARWWEYEERQSQGIFLAGQVDKAQATTSGSVCWVKLGQSTEVIPVLTERGQFQIGDHVGVVGQIVSNGNAIPAELSTRQVVASKHSFLIFAKQ